MIKSPIYLMIICFLFFAVSADAVASGKEKDAVSAAKKWLNLVDNGDYSNSWIQSAEYLRNAVDKQAWEHSMRAFRKPLGNVVSRKVKSTTYQTSLPGAPDGEYVIIQFESSFEKKGSAIETITPMLEKDGIWRVSGYYIK